MLSGAGCVLLVLLVLCWLLLCKVACGGVLWGCSCCISDFMWYMAFSLLLMV